jgi:hypothetical protein
MKILFLLSLIILSLNTVVDLTEKNFDNLVIQSKGVWIVNNNFH